MPNSIKQQASDKIINRIRALLAMGSDTSSENEAAIALKRARKLMDEHQVKLSDIENITESDLGASMFDIGSTQCKTWIGMLAVKVAQMNDCIAKYARRSKRTDNQKLEFSGFKEDVKLCEFMMVYLVDTCNRLYLRDKGKLNLKGISDKNDYLLGMTNGLCERMTEIIDERKKQMSEATDGRSLMVVKSSIVEQAFGEQKTRKTRNYSTRQANHTAYYGGSDASKEIHLGSFVGDKSAPKKMLA